MKTKMEMLLSAGLGGALLAFTACSGDLGPEGTEDAFLDQGSNAVDGFESVEGLEAEDVIEKATFGNNPTFNGFNVSCDTPRRTIINTAEARARQILDIAMPATADARVNRNTQKGRLFRDCFVPGGNLNPDPNRTSPDAWDTASTRVGQKLSKVSQVLSSAVHTCSADNESVRQLSDGTFQTCGQSGISAATSFVGGADNPVRWCDAGLFNPAGTPNIAVTLLHELIHQDRTADAAGTRVLDLASTAAPGLNNVQSYVRWLNNNQPQ